MLLSYRGPMRLWAALPTYLRRHALGTAITEDLREAVLAATGENLDWFWEQWLYQAGHPQFTVSAADDTTGRRLPVTVNQTQGDTAKAGGTGLDYRTRPEVPPPGADRGRR